MDDAPALTRSHASVPGAHARPAPDLPVPAPAAPAGRDVVPQWHRGMTVLAVVSLFIGTRSAWTHAMAVDPPVAAVISAGYAGILVTGVLALAVRGHRALARVDAAVLVLGAVLVVCRFWLGHHVVADEGALTTQAAIEVLRGRPVYGVPWPWVFRMPGVGVTKTMAGGADLTYAYPPLTALAAAPVWAVVRSAAAVSGVVTGALLAGTVVLWRSVPAGWRSAVTAVCLGFGLLPAYARAGYPAVLALALLVPVVVRWHATGAGGRLGRDGAVRAVCLGAACAAQQLAWFLVPFLAFGVYAVVRGRHGRRAARGVLTRYAAVAVACWALINACVAFRGVRAWADGLLLPLTQGGILHGQGAVGLSYYLTSGSGRLDFYTYASALLLAGLLVALVLFPVRLGPALTVLPWLPFFLAPRSQDGYYLLMTPLWLAAAATVPPAALTGAWHPRLARVRGRASRILLACVLLAPSAACLAVAVAGPPPLRLAVTPRLSADRRGIASLGVRAHNATGLRLVPHFATRAGEGASGWWHVVSGPREVAPHAAVTYVLRPPGGVRAVPPGRHPRLFLIAVTGTPMTVSTARVPFDGPAGAGARGA